MGQPQLEAEEPTVGDYIEKYIQLRDKANELKQKHKEELAPYNDAMGKLELYFQNKMNELDLENLKGHGGVAYQTVQSSVTIADWDAFFDYVSENKAFYLLEKRAAKTAVEEILEETGELPPGLNVKRNIKVNVRRN
jgi:hypothetical protein